MSAFATDFEFSIKWTERKQMQERTDINPAGCFSISIL
jgi:hypothetical protein